MTAPRITAERIAELKRHYPRGAYSQNREHHPFGHIAYSTIDINELIDALESAYAELDSLRSAPVAVEVSMEEWEALLDFAERIVPIRDNLSGISWVGKLSDVFAAYDKWYALRAKAQPATEREGA